MNVKDAGINGSVVKNTLYYVLNAILLIGTHLRALKRINMNMTAMGILMGIVLFFYIALRFLQIYGGNDDKHDK